ncbi:MAG TPA: response regulator [Acidobacteriaceae bacterium]
MTSEQQDFSSAEMTPQIPPPSQQGSPGQGQSKSSRRRRRKRNKKPGTVAGAPQTTAEPGEGGVVTIQASVEPGQSISNGNGNGNGNNGSSSAGGPTKRWKKKKFRSGGQGGGNPNPGNQMSNGNGGGGRQQRRTKPKGPRSFVGPMDHSYRDGIGNYADSPPSTIEIHGNHNGNGHRSHTRHNGGTGDSQENFNLGTREVTPVVPENAATHIYCFIDDLFFLAKIQETARKLGVKVVFLKNDKESLATLSDAGETDHPALIVFDLNNASAKPLTLIPKLKTKFKRKTSIVGFLSHLQGDLKAKAVEAGCDTVMPRSAFSQNLPNMLRRYGIEEEEENNFNA